MLDYPHYAADLTKQQLQKLIEVLSIDSDQDAAETEYLGQIRSPQVVQQIQEAIRGLPTELRQRAKWVRMLRHDAKAAVLCEVHEELNALVIGNLFALLKREVTCNLTFLKWYREFSPEEVNNLVDALLAVAGMWWLPESKDDVPPTGAVCFQENQCEACMLARIVDEPWCLRNLRTTLVSRVRTKPEIRIPKLLPFVDTAIRSFAPEGEAAVKAYGGLPCELGYTSSYLAFQVKTARADALIAEETGVEDVVVEEATKVHVDYAGTATLVTPSHSKCAADNVVTVRPLNVKKPSLGEENAALIHNEAGLPEARMVKAPNPDSSDVEEDRLEHEIQALLLPHIAKVSPVGPRYSSSTRGLTQRRRAERSEDLDDLDLTSYRNPIIKTEPSSSDYSSIHTATPPCDLRFHSSISPVLAGEVEKLK
ncbi:hypothetical protein BO82DRAFT_391068 [Aspergillus uvarum CBS 121591]|uniref:Uncharacterized protein n=1 Tax=Aspergillus uvarum CBS 121591 TaxID=1448315 RepID=A0A319CIJ4_9EURO|nr:hypothetical protein BO82DRAFT_391068 [Aspergillus uvarum CBS 121591]PYH83087.1 hypothetical protein BO82DRAFT_391068 [Aspergillus uvarum CBS 121591]